MCHRLGQTVLIRSNSHDTIKQALLSANCRWENRSSERLRDLPEGTKLTSVGFSWNSRPAPFTF